MSNYNKWIGGILGFTVLGPIGALLGFGIGTLFDEQKGVMQQTQTRRATSGDFAISLLVLVAAVMKADGKILRSELDYVKQWFARQFGIAKTGEAMILLRDLLKQNIPLQDVAMQIRKGLDYPSRLQLLHFLYGLASADKHIQAKELTVIDLIAGYLGISNHDKESIRSMFQNETDSAYKILGVDRNTPDDEIKKAYRKMAKENHPDKVSYLGEDVRKAAEEKFQKINHAYEAIKKEKRLS